MNAKRSVRVGAAGVIIRDGSVLLVKFDDEFGPHYNYPGGGHQEGETLRETAAREVKEETDADVEVGKLLVVAESAPFKVDQVYGPTHFHKLLFECRLEEGSEPKLPETPDPNEVAVEWLPLKSISDPPKAIIPDIANQLTTALETGVPQYFEDDGLASKGLTKS